MKQTGTMRQQIAAAEDGPGQRRATEMEPRQAGQHAVSLPAREVRLDRTHVDKALVSLFDDDAISAQYDQLAVALTVGSEQQALKRVLVASTESGDGRTSVVVNLAAALAQTNKRVLIIDCDLRKPTVHLALGLDPKVGLAEVLTDDTPAAHALARVVPAGFDVLPTCSPVDKPMRVLSSDEFHELLTTLDHFYDYILFDAPPLLDPSSHFLVHLTDTVLLVIRSQSTTSAKLSKAIEPLREENLFGVVLNRVPNA